MKGSNVAKFYVNEVHDGKLTNGLQYGQSIIGLFRQCETDGRGNFCGYYGSEYYVETELYAYYVADCKGVYRPEARISELVICDPRIKYHEVRIGSHMWTKVIEARNVEEAIELFDNAKWRRWETPFDEFGFPEISCCPSCGCKPSVLHWGNATGSFSRFECRECDMGVTSSEGTLDAITKWNELCKNSK